MIVWHDTMGHVYVQYYKNEICVYTNVYGVQINESWFLQ